MKAIKLRIRSVESTMQITKAMQLVATSKLRRAKERMENSKPYAAISREAMMAAAASCEDHATIPYTANREVKNRCYIVIAGERGLAGGYNANVFKAQAAHAGDTPYSVLPLGKKAVEKYARMQVPLLRENLVRVEGLSVGLCSKLSKELTEGFLNGSWDELWLVYTDFQSMLNQEVKIEKLLPLDEKDIDREEKNTVVTVYEPSAAETLAAAVPDFIAGRLYSAACDSFASEVSARRSAMDSATKNAGEMISDLRLKYNRARQGAITQEITEIVAGAEN
jgi:F-type H+-transporting ATPase subunit gamma